MIVQEQLHPRQTRPAATPMPIRRRPLAERRVLDYLRDDSYSPREANRLPCALPFFQLRNLALFNALRIHPRSAPFVGQDELQLLGWIARAQRFRGNEAVFHPDDRLTRSIFHCAGILTGLGIVLPPVTTLAGNIVDSPRKTIGRKA